MRRNEEVKIVKNDVENKVGQPKKELRKGSDSIVQSKEFSHTEMISE